VFLAGTTREQKCATAPMKALSNQKFQSSSPSTARSGLLLTGCYEYRIPARTWSATTYKQ
jgi:hypothetical protein